MERSLRHRPTLGGQGQVFLSVELVNPPDGTLESHYWYYLLSFRTSPLLLLDLIFALTGWWTAKFVLNYSIQDMLLWGYHHKKISFKLGPGNLSSLRLIISSTWFDPRFESSIAPLLTSLLPLPFFRKKRRIRTKSMKRKRSEWMERKKTGFHKELKSEIWLEQSRFLFFFIPALQFLYIGIHPIGSLHIDNFQPHNIITKLTNKILTLS
jgi:hypothetical protein